MSRNYTRRGGPEPTPEMELPRPTLGYEKTKDATCAPPTKPVAMAMAFERLTDAISGYEKLFSIANDKMASVCLPQRPTDTGCEKKEPEIQSDLVAAIMEQAERVRRVNGAFGDMIDRCQL